MDDHHYLDALMHGDIPGKKKKPVQETKRPETPFESEVNKKIDEYVEGLEFDDDPKSMRSAQSKRESIKLEIIEAMKAPELSQQIESAVSILFSDGERYLAKEEYQTLISDLSAATARLATIGIDDAMNTNLQTLAKISDDSMKSIVNIAIAKFAEERYADCMALFSLLTILNPAYSEYWLRLGISAQKCDKIESASNAYSAAIELDPTNIGARLFAAECFVKRGLKNEAAEEVEAAKKIIKSSQVDPMWMELLPSIENMIK